MTSKWLDSVGTLRKGLVDIEDDNANSADASVPLDFGNRFRNLEKKIQNELCELEKISKTPSPVPLPEGNVTVSVK